MPSTKTKNEHQPGSINRRRLLLGVGGTAALLALGGSEVMRQGLNEKESTDPEVVFPFLSEAIASLEMDAEYFREFEDPSGFINDLIRLNMQTELDNMREYHMNTPANSDVLATLIVKTRGTATFFDEESPEDSVYYSGEVEITAASSAGVEQVAEMIPINHDLDLGSTYTIETRFVPSPDSTGPSHVHTTEVSLAEPGVESSALDYMNNNDITHWWPSTEQMIQLCGNYPEVWEKVTRHYLNDKLGDDALFVRPVVTIQDGTLVVGFTTDSSSS